MINKMTLAATHKVLRAALAERGLSEDLSTRSHPGVADDSTRFLFACCGYTLHVTGHSFGRNTAGTEIRQSRLLTAELANICNGVVRASRQSGDGAKSRTNGRANFGASKQKAHPGAD
jgi:hypothetical protein